MLLNLHCSESEFLTFSCCLLFTFNTDLLLTFELKKIPKTKSRQLGQGHPRLWLKHNRL